MSKAGEVEEIIAELVAGGLRDPAWIANAYIERIDPDRRMPDLINGACAVHVHHIACQQLGIVEPKGSAYAKPVSSIRFKELRDALDSLRQHANALQMRKRPVGSAALASETAVAPRRRHWHRRPVPAGYRFDHPGLGKAARGHARG